MMHFLQSLGFLLYVTAISAQPNLIISSASLSSTTVAAGSSITVYSTVYNDGLSNANQCIMRYYINTVPMLDINVVELDYSIMPNSLFGLSAKNSENEEESFEIPVTWTSLNAFIIIVVDSDALVTESNENDNINILPLTISGISAPDLTITSSSITPSTINSSGGSVSIASTIKNLGSEAAAPSELKYYLSQDCILDQTDLYLDYSIVPNIYLAPLGTSSEDETMSISAQTPGNYNVILWADAGNTIPEQEELNNLYCLSLTIASTTDLENQQQKNAITIYPNPVVDFLQIIIANQEQAHISIFNTIGECIYKSTFTNATAIDFKSYSAGLYFVEIQDKDQTYTYKIGKK